jgi:hypothetical protein
MPKGKGKNSHHGGPAACVGQNCDWVNGGRWLQCIDGFGTCLQPRFCEAEESSFHDKDLQEATKKINRILARIPADPKDRKLSFCQTYMGTFLAWVEHGDKPLTGKLVTAKDNDKAVAKALKLKSS